MARGKVERLEFAYLPLDLIDVSLSNVRKSNLEEGIDELASSIREEGVQQPVMVSEKGERYELIIGQRRYLACKRAGETEIPAVKTKVKDRTHALIKSFSENIHRLDLDYRDKMQVALELQENLKSIEKVAERLGVSSQTVRNYLGYAAVPEEIKAMVTAKNFSPSTALRISKGIQDEDLALKVAQEVKKMPRSKQRNLLIDLAIENPDEKEVGKLVKMANRMERTKKITIYVTQKVYDALSAASKEYQTDKEIVLKEAVEEWLAKRGFMP